MEVLTTKGTIKEKFSNKKSRQELAKERLKAKSLAYKADKIGIDIKGKDIFALKAAYNRYKVEQTAKKAGFVNADGSGDVNAYKKIFKRI